MLPRARIGELYPVKSEFVPDFDVVRALAVGLQDPTVTQFRKPDSRVRTDAIKSRSWAIGSPGGVQGLFNRRLYEEENRRSLLFVFDQGGYVEASVFVDPIDVTLSSSTALVNGRFRSTTWDSPIQPVDSRKDEGGWYHAVEVTYNYLAKEGHIIFLPG